MHRIRTVVGCLLALGLAACQLPPAPSTTGGSRLDRLLESQTLRVGLSGSQPPLNMLNKRGEIVGLEVDIVEALAESMKLELEIVTVPFAELLPTLESGRVDLVISGMTITPKRNARVAFVGPYFISGKSVLTKSEALASVESPAALDDPARTYAALAGSTSEEFVRELLPRSRLVPTPDYAAGIEMVIGDQADAMVADFPICAISVIRYPDAGLSTLVTPFTIEPLGIALPRDEPLFVNLVENYLHTLEETGLLTQFKAKWFSDGDWVSELP